jgi:uncharacterized membrane protein YjdF
VVLAHLVGAIIAIILLARYKAKAATLALVGFGLLFVVDIARFFMGPLALSLSRQIGNGGRAFAQFNVGLGCCCSIFDVAAIACLIFALWQAVSAGQPSTDAEPDEFEYASDSGIE